MNSYTMAHYERNFNTLHITQSVSVFHLLTFSVFRMTTTYPRLFTTKRRKFSTSYKITSKTYFSNNIYITWVPDIK